MKINKEIAPFESNIESINTDSFALHDQGMIMSLIRDKMYSKKLYTPIQEIISNARDAVREKHFLTLDNNKLSDHEIKIAVEQLYEKNDHVEITFPNEMNPMLIIRDFGIGISKERIEIIKRVGLSTKDKSNLESGGFGLGLKSVFAYTEQFFIVSYLDGIEYTYSAQITTNPMGDLLFIGENSTNEKNGVAIKIPIQLKDFNAANEAVINITGFWKTRPILKGSKISYMQYHNEKEIQTYTDGLLWRRESKHLALIDGIPYPLDLNLYEPEANYQKRDEKIERVRTFVKGNYAIVLSFEVGELDLVMTRENLESSEKNILKITKRIKNLIQSIKDKEKNDYDKAKGNLVDFILYISRNEFLNLEAIHGSNYLNLEFQYKSVIFKSKQNSFEIFSENGSQIYMNCITKSYKKKMDIATMCRLSYYHYGKDRHDGDFDFRNAYIIEEKPFVVVNEKQGAALYSANSYALRNSIIISIPEKEMTNQSYLDAMDFFKNIMGYKMYSVRYPAKINEYNSFKLIELNSLGRLTVVQKDLIVVKNSKKKKKIQYRVDSIYDLDGITDQIIEKYKSMALKLSTIFSTLSNSNIEIIESDSKEIPRFDISVFENILGEGVDTSHLNLKEAAIYFVKLKLEKIMKFQSVLTILFQNKQLLKGDGFGISKLKEFLDNEYNEEFYAYKDRYGSKKPSPSEIRNLKYYGDLFENKQVSDQVKLSLPNAIALEEFLEKHPLIVDVYIYSYYGSKDSDNLKILNIIDYINAFWIKND